MTFEPNLSQLAEWVAKTVCEVCWQPTGSDREVVDTGYADLTIMCLPCWHDYLDENGLEG